MRPVVRRGLGAATVVLTLVAPVSWAGNEAPQSLAELLEAVRQGSEKEQALGRQREEEFRAAKAKQQRLLEEAMRQEEAALTRSAELEARFEENENAIPELEETLRSRLGTLGELFGVVRQVAGDTRSRFETSLISSQIPGRGAALGELAESRKLPSIDDLRGLWVALQEEMTEQGRVVTYPATVVEVGGEESQRPVTRLGAFNVVSRGQYLQYLSESGRLAELARQPARRHLAGVAAFESARSGLVGIAIDPSRGTILSMLIQAPSLAERVAQGGAVGYTIIVLGAIGFAFALLRMGALAAAGFKIRSQVGADHVDPDNALGRVLAVYEQNRGTDVETLELRLDEAILKETSRLQRGATFVKVLSVIAPLMGLLGTVTGMILTFQQITLFGTGDPKLMAGGISQALVTTVLGLVMAIPLTLLYSMISERARTLVLILEEQSLGMVAEQAERLKTAGAA